MAAGAYGSFREELRALKERDYESADPTERSTIAIQVGGNREYVTPAAAQALYDKYNGIQVDEDKTFIVYFDSKPYALTKRTFADFMWRLRGILGLNASAATLDSLIAVGEDDLAPTFSSDTYEYTLNTSSDFVTFEYTKTDENATVKSSPASLEDVPLPYFDGEDKVVSLTVTAEDGTTNRTYEILVSKV